MKLKELLESASAQEKFDSVVYNPKTKFCHESDAPFGSFITSGIDDHSVFCTVNKESNFISSYPKTRIWFHIPKGQKVYISPDMRYEEVEGLVEEHPQITGADVSINRSIPIGWILSIATVTMENGKESEIINHSID